MYFLYKCVFRFCYGIDKGEIFDVCQSHGHLGSTTSLVSVLCDLISSTNEAKKD